MILRSASEIISNKLQKRFYSQLFFISFKKQYLPDMYMTSKETDLLINAANLLEKEPGTNFPGSFIDGLGDPEFFKSYYE
jgi:hypothetical protein